MSTNDELRPPISSEDFVKDNEAQEKPQQNWQNNADIPDGGVKAWLQVLSAWVLFFNTWGLLNTFGEYQTYYESGQVFHASSTDISWIGSLQAFLLLFVGFVTGPLFDLGYLRLLLVVGTFMIAFGHMMLSLVGAYWQAVLAQAFVICIGAGCLFVPSIAVMSGYFSKKISSAIGIAASGSSLGGIIYPIMFHKLLPQVGFPWTVRIIGFMALGLLVIPCVLMHTRTQPQKGVHKLVDVSAFKELPYSVFLIGGLLGFAGLLIPFFYISYYAITSGATNENLGFYLLPILNAASIFGRIIPNIIADKTGPLNMFVPVSLAAAILVYCLIPAKSEGGIIAITLLYGYFSGGFVSLPPSVIVSLTPPNKRATIGTRVGMAFSILALGLLIGPPVAGAILGNGPADLDFTDTWIFAGSLLMGATMLFALTRVVKNGTKVMVKS